MEQLKREIASRFDVFTENWKAGLLTNIQDLDGSREVYLQSYERLTSLQAWRIFLDNRVSHDSIAFFLEAQNDALVSHVLARMGSWRSALKSIRSCIENAFLCMFYMDHPVELNLWHQGNHKVGYSELIKYFEIHPHVSAYRGIVDLPLLQQEYATLSKAVHGSAERFRMTVDVEGTLLWSSATASLSAWSTRERKVISGINLLLLVLFAEHLRGTRLPDLRKSISLAVPAAKQSQVKELLHVVLSQP